jgi:pantoate--beta-alanine ligase
MPIEIVRTPCALQARVKDWRSNGLKVALVPTMGAIHEGHLDLVRCGRETAQKVVASIYVNPTQFAVHEDLSTYPRDEAGDARALDAVGCDLIYAPDNNTMYPKGFSTQVLVGGLTQYLEGAFRPQFFGGVATIVSKLLLQALPDVALFGEKDWQQLQVVTTLVRDLNIPTRVYGVATRREADGLALSSRNAYLNPSQRNIAPALYLALQNLCDQIVHGVSVKEGEAEAKRAVLAAGFSSVDYLCACNAQTLEPWVQGEPLRVLAAAYLGKTRLIDNVGPA